MTQEEKLKEAKRLYEISNDDQKYVLERLFPELVESEDERIKGMLIKYFKERQKNADLDELFCGLSYNSILNWLEKQGKWNNSIWHKVKPNEYVLEKTLIYKKNGEIDLVEDTILSVTDAKYALPVSSLGIPKSLEKQGEKEYVLKSSKDKDFVRKFVQCIEKEAKAYEINLPNRGYDIYAFAKDILDWLENQSEQKPAEWHREDEQNLNACFGYIPDEFLRRWLKDVIHVKYDKLDNIEALFGVGDIISNGISEVKIVSIDKNYYIVTNDEIENDANVCNWVIYFKNQDDWKLVKQKSNDKPEPRFKVKYAGSEYNVFEVKDICNITYYGIEDEPNHIDYVKADSCEIIEDDNNIKENNFSIPTKPIVFSDKVESKFHNGDWIVTTYGKVNQVVSVDKDGDGYTLADGVYFSGSWSDMYHLWTIQDAKDGDILFTSSTASHEIFIFKSIDENGNVECYFTYDSEDGFREGKYHFIGSATNCKPATKEQRDILFQMMKKAGYKWNAEKKELRKIL